MKKFSKTLINYIENKYKNTQIIPKSGDVIELLYKIKDNEKERPITYQGTIIATKNKTINKSFIFRQNLKGHIITQKFFTHSPNIIKFTKKNNLNKSKAKLYYLKNI